MTDRDLESLSNLPVPPPRDAARKAALDVAMAAFDQSLESKPTPKGIDKLERPISAPHAAARRKFMTLTRTHYAMAASVAALMIAAPAAFQLYETSRPGDVGAPADLRTQVPAKTLDRNAEAQKVEAEKIASQEDARSESGAGRIAAPEPSPIAATDDGKAGGADLPAKPVTVVPIEEKARQDESAAQVVAAAPPPPAPPPAGSSGDTGEERKRVSEVHAAAKPKMKREAMSGARPESRLALGGGAAMPTDGLGAVGSYRTRELRDQNSQFYGGPLANVAPAPAPVASAYEPSARPAEIDRDQIPLIDKEFRDKFESKDVSPVKQVSAEPVSTFSIDVDTASYAFVRRMLNAGQLPPKDAVRVEEMINYFPYDYPKPENAETPFQPTVTVMPSPWNPANQLVHVAIKGYEIAAKERPRANLVLLIDVSGSMSSIDKLPLVKNAFRLLVDELKADDTVAIVTYASGSGIALEPTKIAEKGKILAAIDRLGAGGSTAGAEGIQDAYRLAESSFDKSAVNRVILATDGDFNVGITDQDDLKGLIERKREKGIFLSILGVGQGNYNDALMQSLAQNGNGTAAYVDTLNEARKVLVDEASSTLFTIAKDVKVQIEWNPRRVAEYRLVGYETRALKREDFNNDKVDAGDIGSGHTVTAIYEITPVGAPTLVDGLRYDQGTRTASAEQRAQPASGDAHGTELGFLKLRYKLPKEDASKLVDVPITDLLAKDKVESASQEARFSVAVAAFGQLLKGAPYLKGFGFDDVVALAQSAKGDDKFGYRAELINLVRLAKSAQP